MEDRAGAPRRGPSARPRRDRPDRPTCSDRSSPLALAPAALVLDAMPRAESTTRSGARPAELAGRPSDGNGLAGGSRLAGARVLLGVLGSVGVLGPLHD